jgi:hypothetical protein
MQEGCVFRFQYKLVGLATVHGSSLHSGSSRWPTLAYAAKSGKLFIAEFRHQVTRVASKGLVFSLSVASLLFFNGLAHLAGTVRAKRYAPGVISGVLLYLPLALYAFCLCAGAGRLTLAAGAMAGLLGVLYQAVPIGYLGLSSMARRA